MKPADQIGIRAYRAGDRDAFAALVSAVLTEFGLRVDPVLEADLDDPVSHYDGVWVATDQGAVVGSVAIRLLRDGQEAELKRMYVHPDLRGRGAGRLLLDQAISWARDRACRAIVLDTSLSMTAAQRLYESAGFIRTGTRTETGRHDSRCEILYALPLTH